MNSAPFPHRVRNVLYFLRNSIDLCTPFSPREGKLINFMKSHEFYIKSWKFMKIKEFWKSLVISAPGASAPPKSTKI